MGGSAIGTNGTSHDNLTVMSLLPTNNEYITSGGSSGSRATATKIKQQTATSLQGLLKHKTKVIWQRLHRTTPAQRSQAS